MITNSQKKSALGVAMTRADSETSITEQINALKMNKAKADEADTSSKLDKVLAAIGTLSTGFETLAKRMDSMEAEKKAEDEAKAKADSDAEEEAKKKAEAEEEAKKKADEEAESKKKADEDGDGEKAKADALAGQKAILDKISALEKAIPLALSDADYKAMTDAQARADKVAYAFGDAAPRPLQGETLISYRQRLVNGFKSHSKAFKDVDISTISDPKLLGVIEDQIYADALHAGNNPVVAEGGTLREMKRRDQTGREISTFVGDIGAWMNQFKAQRSSLTAINKQF